MASEAFAFQNPDLTQVHRPAITGQEIAWNQIVRLWSSSYSTNAASKATMKLQVLALKHN